MRRRELLTVLGGAMAWPIAARAQQPAQRIRRIGELCGYDGNNPLFRSYVAETLQALSQMGWDSGRNVQFIERWPGGDAERTAAMAKELVELQPDVILTEGGAAVALQKETRAIPIVFLDRDPVGSGLVASLARPGGNLTGISNSEETVTGKMLSLLKSTAPRITRAAIMFNPDAAPPSSVHQVDSFQTAARSLAIEPIVAHVRSDEDIERTITLLGSEQGGLVAAPNAFNNIHRATVIASSLHHGVSVIFDGTEFARQGGLLQYGPDFRVLQRRMAFYVDRILRGVKPSDLPVELPTKYIFVINLKTAKAVGLTVPPSLLADADEVIE